MRFVLDVYIKAHTADKITEEMNITGGIARQKEFRVYRKLKQGLSKIKINKNIEEHTL